MRKFGEPGRAPGQCYVGDAVQNAAGYFYLAEFGENERISKFDAGEFAAGETNKYIRCSASPRGAQALILASKIRALMKGRYNTSFKDVRRVYLMALRILLNLEAQAENIQPDAASTQILKEVKETAPGDGSVKREE